jgi:hypothetical protein
VRVITVRSVNFLTLGHLDRYICYACSKPLGPNAVNVFYNNMNLTICEDEMCLNVVILKKDDIFK